MKSCAKYLLSVVIFSFSLLTYALDISPLPDNGVINLDSQSATINFSNTSSSATPMSLSLSSTVGFSLSVDRCSGKSLAPKTTCYIVININDTLLSNGVNTAQLSNNSNLLFSVQRTRIQNSGSSLFSSSSSIDMSDFSARSIVITNRTSSTKSYSPVLSGTDASKFEISLNRCQSVTSGKTCTFSVKLKPQRAGSYSATISEPQISSSVSLSSTITSLTAGVVPEPVESISVSPSSLSFGILTKFTVSQAQNITITNTGNKIVSPIISVSSTSQIVLNRCTQLSPSQSCSISVALKPTYQTDENGSFVGQVSIKSSVSATPQNISLSSTLQVPPASIAYNGQGGTCPSGSDFVNNVCQMSVSPYPASCSQIYADNPSSTNGSYTVDFDGLGGNSPQSVYCDFANNEAYIEVFDLSREPSLTNTDILNRLNAFSTTSLSPSQLLRDPNGTGIMWAPVSGINGLSYGINKLSVSGLKMTMYKSSTEPAQYEGGFSLHSSDKTNCIPDYVSMTGCYDSSIKSASGQIVFAAFDGRSGGSNNDWDMYYSNGQTPVAAGSQVTKVVSGLSNSVFITSYGRTYGGSDAAGKTIIYLTALRIKSQYFYQPRTCAEAKTRGSLNLDGNTNSGIYSLDHDGYLNVDSPLNVYCDMSGSGVAKITNSCNNARIYGQKSLNNDLISGAYLIDFTGAGSYSTAANQYCEMSQTGWTGNEGGYTLVGVFNTNSVLSAQSNISSISEQNVYLNDTNYQSILANAKEVILKSNRGDSTDVIFKVLKSSIPFANCSSASSTTLLPINFSGSYTVATGNSAYWFWGETYGCNLSGGDYTLVGIRSDIGNYFSLYNLSTPYVLLYNWTNQTFSNSWDIPGEYNLNNSYIHVPKDANESLYIFIK